MCAMLSSMDTHLTAGLVLYALVTSITPGPNNMMLMASGANFGVRRTLPHVAGVVGGFATLLLAAGLGVASLFALVPALKAVMRAVMAAWILWLAWKLARLPVDGAQAADAPSPARDGERRDRPRDVRPMGLMAAMLFQWINPKAWAMVLGATALYLPPAHDLVDLFLMAAIYALVMLPCVMLWVLAGRQLQRWLRSPRRQRAFNVTAAALLVSSLFPILFSN